MSLSRKLQMVGFNQEGYIARFSSGSDQVSFSDIRIDGSDNIYLCGTVGIADAGAVNGTTAFRGLLAKVDVDANVTWDIATGISGNAEDYFFNSVRLDASGDPVVCGAKRTSLALSGSNGIVGEYSSSDGSQTFLKEFNQAGGNFFGLAIDGSGNIFCSGRVYIRTYVNSQGDTLTYITNVVVKYNSSGVQQSVGEIENDKNPSDEAEELDGISTIVLDGSGNVYNTSSVDDTGGGTEAALINKFNSSCAWQTSYKWFINVFTSVAEMYATDINSSGVIAVTGGYPYQATPSAIGAFCGTYNTSTNAQSYFVRRYSDAVSPENLARYYGCRFDSSDNLHLCGTNVITGGDTTGFVDKYDSSLVLQWTKDFKLAGTNTIVNLYKIDVDSQGNVYACGDVDGDGLLIKLPPDGILTGTYGDFIVSENTGTESPTYTTGSRTVATRTNTGTSADDPDETGFAVTITPTLTNF